jgi:predicted glycosyltransferase
VSARVFFYVQHLLGIGHLARASRIAEALLRHGLDVTLVTGGRPVPGLPPPGVPTLALPPLVSTSGFSALLEENGRVASPAFLARRRERLLQAYRELAPEVLLIEAYPFGRRQMRFEIEPLLELARKAGSPTRIVATSLRDILQENRAPDRLAETVAVLARSFDLVLVHGDPDFVPLETTFPETAAIAHLVRYTGIVSAPPGPLEGPSADIVVSAGGGAAGQSLMRAAREASRRDERGRRWLLLTGTNIDPAAFAELAREAPPWVTVERHRPDFGALLAAAAVSVSQAGYNTAADVLEAGCRAVMVPFDEGGETEQTRRAGALAARRLVRLLPAGDLTPQRLLEEIAQALAAPVPAAGRPQLGGAERTAHILLERLGR